MAEMISGGLTLFTIFLGIAVVLYWFDSAKNAITSKNDLTPHQWLILGVFFGFISLVLDNAYWLIAWTLKYYDPQSEYTEFAFENGVLFNIPFRQFLGILAAYFHIKAVLVLDANTTRKFKWFVVVSAIIGVLFSASLFITKG